MQLGAKRPFGKVNPKENGILAGQRREGIGGTARLYLFSLFCFRDLCRSPMSTTAARIPAFRQCILPAGWDMARPPSVPGRALALPPRAPAGRAPRALRRLLPAREPAPRPRAASHAWAPPRLGEPRGSGDWALTSQRPSASPQDPPGGRPPLSERGHFQGSLGARPGRAARGLQLRLRRPRRDPALAPPPVPSPGLRGCGAAGRTGGPAASTGQRPLGLSAGVRLCPRPGSRPTLALALALSVSSSALLVPRPLWLGRAPSLGKGG